MQALLLVFAAIALAMALPAILPLVAILNWQDGRRRRVVAAITRCERCDTMLGRAALALADTMWTARFAMHSRDMPAIGPRLIRDVWAVCDVCGARYGFDRDRRVFVQLPSGTAQAERVLPSLG